MNFYKISIIIPIYNIQEYLESCLHSVTNQSLKEIEIICVDDESTDNSSAIIKKYQEKDNRIKRIWLILHALFLNKSKALASTKLFMPYEKSWKYYRYLPIK